MRILLPIQSSSLSTMRSSSIMTPLLCQATAQAHQPCSFSSSRLHSRQLTPLHICHQAACHTCSNPMLRVLLQHTHTSSSPQGFHIPQEVLTHQVVLIHQVECPSSQQGKAGLSSTQLVCSTLAPWPCSKRHNIPSKCSAQACRSTCKLRAVMLCHSK